MTTKELIEKLEKCDPNAIVALSPDSPEAWWHDEVTEVSQIKGQLVYDPNAEQINLVVIE